MRTFILQALSQTTEEPDFEARLDIDDIGPLRELLGHDASDDPDLTSEYRLDDRDLSAITARWGLLFDPYGRIVLLSPWHALRNAPYLIHTGFELSLMIEGRKPLAMFSDAIPADWFDDLVGRFDPFVDAGRFVKRVIDDNTPIFRNGERVFDGIRHVYIALPGEDWRIDAHILLRDIQKHHGWTETLEVYEGYLLGYERWQNDWWLGHRRRLMIKPADGPD